MIDSDRAIEMISYVAKRTPIPDLYHVLKILYFADKEHLEDYGRQLYGDTYIAMSHGPVPSTAYDILKFVRGDGTFCNIEHAKNVFDVVGNHVKPLRDAYTDDLSQSEIECLNRAIGVYGDMSFGELRTLSHDSAFCAADENDEIPLNEIIKTLPSGAALMEHVANPFPGD